MYCIVDLNKTITGYYKGNKNDNIHALKKIQGNSHTNWKDLVWNSKHSAIEIRLPLHLFNSVGDDSSIDRLSHTLTHVFVNTAKIVTKSDTGDIDAFFDDSSGTLLVRQYCEWGKWMQQNDL